MIKKNKTAFTLVELLIVITVIAIIMGIAIIGGVKLSNNAKLVAARALTSSSPVKDIANLELWLDSTAKESFKESEIYGSGVLSVWYDINQQSSSQNNATQATPGLRPNYQTNAINGLPAVFFGTAFSTAGMVVASTLDITANYSIFIVFKTGSSASGRSLQSQSINWLLGTHVTPCICHYANTAWVSNSVPQIANKTYLAEVVRNSISKFYINGIDNTVDSAPNTPPRNLSLSGSGQQWEPMNGYIGEVIVFTRDLNDSERQDIEDYLIKKWKIS